MNHRLRFRLSTTAVVVALAVVTAPSAAASFVDAEPSRLVLTVAEGESAGPIARLGMLRCDPTGGTHPAAEQVCDALSIVDGEPRMAGTPSGTMCPLIYDPVTVTMRGTLDGVRVDHERTYGNDCVLRDDTGPLFDL